MLLPRELDPVAVGSNVPLPLPRTTINDTSASSSRARDSER